MYQNTIVLTVIIPTLNEGLFLPRLLKDLAEQKEKNFEVIIVDGSSTDKTVELAKTFSKYFPLHIYETKNRNVSHQRNLGVEKAKTSFMCFIDADARITPNFTYKLSTHINSKSLIIPKLKSENNDFLSRVLIGISNLFIYLFKIINKPISAGGSIFINKDLFLKLKGFNEKLFISEDHDLIKRANKNGVSPSILTDVYLTFSMRRLEREGFFVFIGKFLYSYLYQFLKGSIKRKIYSYEMGGEYYYKTKNSK